MLEAKYITICSNRRKIVLDSSTILYAVMSGKIIEIHVLGGNVFETRMTLSELEELLGDTFIKVHRGCMVSAMAIHSITDKINLNNGESLIYTIRKKKELIEKLQFIQKCIISNFYEDDIPQTKDEYLKHYSSFDSLPFAFADIEMIFDEEKVAIDWIFRYGNAALSRLEKLPLEQLIGHSFGNLFANMDSKWLRGYERTTLYGETLEIVDYSPEIDTYLKVICFPTFKGHCGCILFNISEIEYIQNSPEAEDALRLYLGKRLTDRG